MSKKEFLCLAAVVAFAGALSFYRLSADNLWWDEAVNLIYAGQSLKGLSFSSIFIIPHAPLYFQLLHAVSLLGRSELVLRLSSAVFGTVSVAFFYLLAREVAGRAAAVTGSLLLAIAPIRLWYSQEATPHIMAFCLALAALFYFYSFSKRRRPGAFFLWMFFNVLSFYTTHHSLLLLPAQLVFLLLCGREIDGKVWKRFGLGAAVQAALYLPQVLNLCHSLAFLRSGFWIPPLDIGAPAYTLVNFFLGYGGTLAMSFLAFVVCVVLLARVFSARVPTDVRRLFLAFGAFPLLAVALAHAFIRVYIDRHNMLFLPAFFIAVSAGLVSIKGTAARFWTAFALSGTMALAAVNYYRNTMPLPAPSFGHSGVYIKRNVSEVVEYIRENMRPGDAVVDTSISLMGLLQYYFHDGTRIYYLCAAYDPYWTARMDAYRRGGPGGNEQCVDTLWGTLVYMDTPENETSALRLLPRRIWLLQSSWGRDGSLEENAGRSEEIVRSRYSFVRDIWINGVRISLYTKR